MKYIITDIKENTHTFENSEEANKYIQKVYKEHNDLYPTVDSIRKDTIFIVYERMRGIYEWAILLPIQYKFMMTQKNIV